MSAVFHDVVDELTDYREAYRKDGLEVPDHEIVMHPEKHCDLMDDPIAVHNVDHTAGFRNFQGIPILLTPDAKGIEVRDRTIQI